MNIWDIDNFSNEAAEEWLYDFGENDFRLIDRTLAGVAYLLPVDELDAFEAAEALVAAETVAAALGAKAESIPEELAEWLEENPVIQVKDEYVEMAQKAVKRILEQSELREHWQNTDQFGAWQSGLQNLLARLSPLKS
ncbi:MAG: DUF4259 domain-containing protein [Chloroflexota bacterium]